ncbi:response regulator [Anaeromicropila herbilytica]|uniref:Stage 0 sporulation protein A homolog n=1 Tax=Anaeromicropila herbilytica TaxID=2785025 RepID=A0A7R7EL19_9FIRM|nr:response regulator [Anaeromicropila herbilytica]BCN30556.1 response regulator [Anaeromicropila herbilytica]
MKKVLIVDDAEFMRLSLRTFLGKHGYEIIGEAADGKMALDLYEKERPDIVTMDLTMPVMDGIESIKEIMKIDKDAKILVVSAMGQETKVRDAILAGAKNFIVKPFTEESVLKVLSTF